MQTAPDVWPVDAGEAFAGVSASGYGGANVHVVLGGAPASETSGDDARPQLLALSARSREALSAFGDDTVFLERYIVKGLTAGAVK